MIENQKRAEYRDKLICSSHILKSNPILSLIPCLSTGPKRFGLDQKQLFTSGRVQNGFGPIEGQGKSR